MADEPDSTCVVRGTLTTACADSTSQDPPEEGYDNGLDCIEDDLWLGNLTATCNYEIIKSKKISRILTIDIWPLPKKITELRNIIKMTIPVSDLPTEDLISYFATAHEFIENGLKDGAVLVHCFQGVSRSATFILAHLMKKHQVGLERAIEIVITKRRVIQPNPGFMAQLKLYEDMNFKIDPKNMQYRMFRLYIAADKFRTTKTLPLSCMDVIKSDPAVDLCGPGSKIYKCKKCRRILASEFNIIPHFPRDKYTWRDIRYTQNDASSSYCHKIIFTEPLAWMTAVPDTVSGKLYCPNPRCQVKLGSYCWISGCLCPCGTKVAPAFYLIPSKVDLGIVVKQMCE